MYIYIYIYLPSLQTNPSDFLTEQILKQLSKINRIDPRQS